MKVEFKNIYFLGIGGIGMSALARFFLHEGKSVAGYDRTSTPLTLELESEGAQIHYEDDIELVDKKFLSKEDTLVIYTPAIPKNHSEYNFFLEAGYQIVKRSKALGYLAQDKYVMAVAGTHGKTTTTTLTAWLNHVVCKGRANAFLGGISKNFDSNLVLGKGDRLAVEADEFDRSFLQLYPNVAVITAADADHLDIYGTHDAVKQAFSEFISQIKPGGSLILRKGVDLEISNTHIKVYTYSFDEESDFFVINITLLNTGKYCFDIVCPDRIIKGCTLGLPGRINVENAVAAVALLWAAGLDDEDALREGLATFSGVKRRFDFYLNTDNQIYIDDYAHHPKELQAAISSIKSMFSARHITAIFQPHLFTRTNDFYQEFAKALSLSDRVILLPIYPARELPIEGVTSKLIGDLVSVPVIYSQKEDVVALIEQLDTDVVISFGAGDIDNYCKDIHGILSQKLQK
ncbi:MAG: UDP-N-acetylmuramate--L-alanine ligase [Rikenellaceae bacterium]